MFLSLSPSLTLNVLTYPVIIDIIKTNGLIALSKYLVKYLESVFVLTNCEINLFLQHGTFILLLWSHKISNYYTMNNIFMIIF